MSRFLGHIYSKPLVWIITLFIILPFLAFPEIIFGEQTLYWSDLSWMHYPRRIFAAEEWLAGRIPLWDPYQHSGLPFLAETQVSVLYIFSVLFLSPISPSLELSLFILMHYALAVIFTFILAKSLGMGLAASTVCGLGYGMGGFLMSQVANLNIMTGAVWLPLILYGAIQTTKKCSWFAAMLAGIPLALQVFTAQPQIVFYTLVTVCGYAIYRAAADFCIQSGSHRIRLRRAGHTLLLLAVMTITGLLLAAPQLLPTLELQQLSVRSEEREFEFLTKNSLPPAMWLNLAIPSAFGNNVTGFRGGDPFQEDFIYIGLIPILLVMMSLSQHHRRDMIFFVLLALVGIVMAMGRYTPVYGTIVQYLPGFALFRIPARWLMVVNLSLAVLAGFGLDRLVNQGLTRKKLLTLMVLGASILLGLLLVWIFQEPLQNWTKNSWRDNNHKLFEAFLDKTYPIDSIYQTRLLLGSIYWLLTPLYLFMFNLIIALVIFSLFTMRKISANAFGVSIILAVSIDLVLAGGTTVNPTQPDSWWHQLSGGAQYVVNHLEGKRVFPLGMGSEQATVSHLGQYFPSVYRVRSAGGHGSSLMLERTEIFLQNAHPVQAIQTLGVRYLLTEGQMGADAASTYPIAYNDETSYVYENKSPLPRTFVVHDAIQVETPDEALSYFETVAVDPSQTVVLETEGNAPPPAATSSNSTAEIRSETPQEIEVEVNTAADGYLVLLDTYYPGWMATVDNEKHEIYPANYIGRAVFVPQGRHIVRFEYRPLSFYIGVWLSLVTLFSIVTLGFIENHRYLLSYRREKSASIILGNSDQLWGDSGGSPQACLKIVDGP